MLKGFSHPIIYIYIYSIPKTSSSDDESAWCHHCWSRRNRERGRTGEVSARGWPGRESHSLNYFTPLKTFHAFHGARERGNNHEVSESLLLRRNQHAKHVNSVISWIHGRIISLVITRTLKVRRQFNNTNNIFSISSSRRGHGIPNNSKVYAPNTTT